MRIGCGKCRLVAESADWLRGLVAESADWSRKVQIGCRKCGLVARIGCVKCGLVVESADWLRKVRICCGKCYTVLSLQAICKYDTLQKIVFRLKWFVTRDFKTPFLIAYSINITIFE